MADIFPFLLVFIILAEQTCTIVTEIVPSNIVTRLLLKEKILKLMYHLIKCHHDGSKSSCVALFYSHFCQGHLITYTSVVVCCNHDIQVR